MLLSFRWIISSAAASKASSVVEYKKTQAQEQILYDTQRSSWREDKYFVQLTQLCTEKQPLCGSIELKMHCCVRGEWSAAVELLNEGVYCSSWYWNWQCDRSGELFIPKVN